MWGNPTRALRAAEHRGGFGHLEVIFPSTNNNYRLATDILQGFGDHVQKRDPVKSGQRLAFTETFSLAGGQYNPGNSIAWNRFHISLLSAHGHCHYRLAGMQPVLSFLIYHRLRAIDNLVGHLVAAIGREAMHINRLLLGT